MDHSPDSLFVGNLAFDVSKEELIERFAEVAPVQSVKVITDHNTGLSRGCVIFCQYNTNFIYSMEDLPL